MNRYEIKEILAMFGINENIAEQMIDAAANRGKYDAILINTKLASNRTITIHHGMKGNTWHYWTIEIK